METLGSLINTIQALQFGHARREANKVADLMVNVRMGGGLDLKEGQLQYLEGEKWVDQWRHLASMDYVATRYIEGTEHVMHV